MYLLGYGSKKSLTEAIDEDSLMTQLKEALGPSVDEKLRQSGEEGLTPLTLRRWLVARKWDLQAAKTDLAKHADWRVKYNPTGRVSETDIAEQLSHRKATLQGLDKKGRAVIFVASKNHIPLKDYDKVRLLTIYGLDAAIALCDRARNPRARLVCIMDITDFSMANWDLAGGQLLAEVLQNHYVERIDKILIYNPPYFFYALWKLVAAFLDPVTKDKVQFLSKEEAPPVLQEMFDPEILPPHMGGTGALVPVEETVSKHNLHYGQLPPSSS